MRILRKFWDAVKYTMGSEGGWVQFVPMIAAAIMSIIEATQNRIFPADKLSGKKFPVPDMYSPNKLPFQVKTPSASPSSPETTPGSRTAGAKGYAGAAAGLGSMFGAGAGAGASSYGSGFAPGSTFGSTYGQGYFDTSSALGQYGGTTEGMAAGAGGAGGAGTGAGAAEGASGMSAGQALGWMGAAYQAYQMMQNEVTPSQRGESPSLGMSTLYEPSTSQQPMTLEELMKIIGYQGTHFG